MINLAQSWIKAFASPDRREIHEWAQDCVTLPEVLARSGKFQIENSRHFIEPMRALRDPRVREVNVLAGVRTGKTLIADIAAPWAVINEAASILWIFPKDEIAKEHAELRAWPVLESVEAIKPMIPENRHKKRVQEILFTNGLPLMLRGPSLSNLQSRGFKWVILDEPWLYKAGVIGEAKGRLGDFVKTKSSKLLAISQGGDEESDWATQHASGEQYPWHVQCAKCAEYFAPTWSGFRADGSRHGMVYDAPKRDDGRYDIHRAVETMRVECPHCGHGHTDSAKTRGDWDRTGTYQGVDYARNPNVSFRWNALIDYPWDELMREWLNAREAAHAGNPHPTVIFFQKRMAEHKSENTVHMELQEFVRDKTEVLKPTDKPDWESGRFLSADRQAENLFWVMIRIWAQSTGKSVRLWWGYVYDEAGILAKQAEYSIPPDCVVVDSGYLPRGDHGVYAACARNGWIALKGDDAANFWHKRRAKDGSVRRFTRPWSPVTWADSQLGLKGRSKKCPLFRFTSNGMADRVQELIDKGLWIEPTDDPDSVSEREYRAQMSAEFRKPKTNRVTGKREMVWVQGRRDNHAWDCAKMQVAAAMIAGLMRVEIDEK